MSVSAAVIAVGQVSAFLAVASAEMVSFCGGMACGKVGKDGLAIGIEILDGSMPEQRLERWVSFHHPADQGERPAYPCAAWSGGDRSWSSLSWSGQAAA